MGFSARFDDIKNGVVQVEREIEMKQANTIDGKSIWRWIALGIMFAAFFAVAAS